MIIGSVITGLDPTHVNPSNPFPLFVIQVRKQGRACAQIFMSGKMSTGTKEAEPCMM